MKERCGQKNRAENRLSGLTTYASHGHTPTPDGDISIRRHVKLVDNVGRNIFRDRITPLIGEQAIPPFRVHWGGGREYGGGFSKEAIRRAKRKRSS